MGKSSRGIGAGNMLSLVTVAFNNPAELEKTAASVLQQTVQPHTYVVVDSSDEALQPTMRSLASLVGAKYVWTPPTGVYPAMSESMKHVPDNSWVWWLNSSDWLAGTKSIESVVDHIDAIGKDGAHWIIGELLRSRKGVLSLHETGQSGEEFLRLLESGRTGFPHPSTIFWKPSLTTLHPYEDGFTIASDYAVALRFGRVFGPPQLIPTTLSIHDPTGLTARHPLKNLIEKSQSRARMGLSDLASEVWRLPFSSSHAVVKRLVGEKKPAPTGGRAANFPLQSNHPFDAPLKIDRLDEAQ